MCLVVVVQCVEDMGCIICVASVTNSGQSIFDRSCVMLPFHHSQERWCDIINYIDTLHLKVT